MPPQPKIDTAKRRSQISHRADDSFPVKPVWFGMPSVTDFDVHSSIIPKKVIKKNQIITRKVMFVLMYVTGSTGKTEDRSF